MFDFLTGKTSEQRHTNEREAYAGLKRDRSQREDLFSAQNKERQKLQERIDAMRAQHREQRMRLARQIGMVLRHDSIERLPPGARQQTRSKGLDFDR